MLLKTIWIKILFSFLLFVVNFSVFADTTDFIVLNAVEIDENTKSIVLNPYIRVWHSLVKFEASTIINAIKNKQLTEYTTIKSPGYSKDYFWILFEIKNANTNGQSVYIELDNPHVDTCYLYKISGNKKAELIGQSGDQIPFYDRTYNNPSFVFPVFLKKNETVRYIMHVNKRMTSISYPLKVWGAKAYKKQISKKTIFLFFYFGILVMWFVIALFIALLSKNLLLLSYSVYVLFLFLFVFVTTGYAFQFFFPNTPKINEIIRFPFSIFIPISLAVFSNQFIDTKRYIPKIKYIFYSLYGLSVVNLISWMIFYKLQRLYPGLLIGIQYFLVLFIFLLIFFSLYKLFNANRKNVIIYLLATGALTAGFVFHVLMEVGIISRDSTIVSPILIGSFVELVIFVSAIIVSVRDTYKSENDLLLLLAASQKENLSYHIKGAEEQAYKISTELHDNVGSQLAYLKRQINDLENNPKQNILLKTVTNAYEDIRKLSQLLSPTILKITDFKTASTQFLKDYFAHTNIKIIFYIEENANIRKDIALPLYRIIQEASVNCLKHAKATEFSVQIFEHETEIVASIEDNGKGFKMNGYNFNKGIGILNMKSRAESIDGEFDISSFPQKGTSIIVKIPK